jgi:hypothetical protein
MIWIFFLFWMSIAIFVQPRTNSMNRSMLQTSVNVVDRHTLEVSLYDSYDIMEFNKKYYTIYGPMSWIIPIPYYYGVRDLIHRLPDFPPQYYAFSWPSQIAKQPEYLHVVMVWFLTAPLAALLVVQVMRYAHQQGCSVVQALLTAFLCGYGTLLFPYSSFYSIKDLAFLIGGNTVLWHLNRNSAISLAQYILTGLLFGCVVCVDYGSLFFVLISMIFLYRRRKNLRWMWCVFAFILCLAGLAYYHYVLLGNPFLTPYHYRLLRFHRVVVYYKQYLRDSVVYLSDPNLGLRFPPNLEALLGLTVSAFRGVFIYCPALILGFLGHLLSWKDGKNRPFTMYAISIFFTYLAFISCFKSELYWDGGVNMFGPRYLLAAIPMIVMGVMYLHPKLCKSWYMFILAGGSVFINLLGVMFQNQMLNHHFNDPILQNPIRHFSQVLLEKGMVIPLLAHYHVSQTWQSGVFFGMILLWGVTIGRVLFFKNQLLTVNGPSAPLENIHIIMKKSGEKVERKRGDKKDIVFEGIGDDDS